jgi:hypothetical protein
MWLLPAEVLCRNHLLGEHNELHKLAGCILKNKSLKGYLYKGHLTTDPAVITQRHQELVDEMLARGYNHNSPLPNLPNNYPHVNKIDVLHNYEDLVSRCEECRTRIRRGMDRR